MVNKKKIANDEESTSEEESSNEEEDTNDEEEESTNEEEEEEDEDQNQSDELSFMDIPEYHFELHSLKNKTDSKCLKCKNKCTNVYNLAVCKSCLYQLTITKTIAMKLYNLKKTDLDALDFYEYKNGYRGHTHLYFIKEIRLAAIKKRFNIDNPSRCDYVNCLNILGNEYVERKIRSQERRQKILENKEKKLEARNRLCRKIETKLAQKGMRINKYSKYYQQYLDQKIELTEAIKQMKKEDDLMIKLEKERNSRRKKLSRALAKKNLTIRNDSIYCNNYINGCNNYRNDEDDGDDGNDVNDEDNQSKKYALNNVVKMMVIMDFFAKETNYFELLQDCKNTYQSDNKYLDYHDRMYIDEGDKEHCKIKALQEYIKQHSCEVVPPEVLDKYQKHLRVSVTR